MSVKTIKEWCCDLCFTTRRVEQNTKPTGWADISIENPQCDRSFTDKCVCDACIKMILIRSNMK